MSFPAYTIVCTRSSCVRPAIFKIAARWSDGQTEELKTYGLACSACLAELYDESLKRRSACRLSHGESIDMPGVYELTRGSRDRQLIRHPELEKGIS